MEFLKNTFAGIGVSYEKDLENFFMPFFKLGRGTGQQNFASPNWNAIGDGGVYKSVIKFFCSLQVKIYIDSSCQSTQAR